MTVLKGFLIVLLSGLAFALVGALIGYTLGTAMPGYYRAMFRGSRDPEFDPVAVGVGQGLTQGLVGGMAVGAVIVLAVAWYNSRRRALEVEFQSPRQPGAAERPAETQGITTRPG
jgi:hypothetical protein